MKFKTCLFTHSVMCNFIKLFVANQAECKTKNFNPFTVQFLFMIHIEFIIYISENRCKSKENSIVITSV